MNLRDYTIAGDDARLRIALECVREIGTYSPEFDRTRDAVITALAQMTGILFEQMDAETNDANDQCN